MVGWVAHAILVSALGPNPSFFLFWATFIRLGVLLEQGLGLGLGPGLDNWDHGIRRGQNVHVIHDNYMDNCPY